MNKKGKRIFILLLTSIIAFTFASCGGKKTTEADAQNGAYVYVPTFTLIRDEKKNLNMINYHLNGEKLYYSLNTHNPEMTEKDYSIVTVDVADGSKTETLEVQGPQVDGCQSNMNGFQIDEEGNIYVLYDVWPDYVPGEIYGDEDYSTYLIKYESNGNKVYEQNLRELLKDKNSSYIQGFQIGKEGKLFVACNNVIYIIGSDGVPQMNIPTQAEWINGLVATEDGKLFYSQTSSTDEGMELVEINTEKKTSVTVYKNLPEVSNLIRSGSDGKFLIKGSSFLYEYDMEKQETLPVLKWSDSNITADYVGDMVKLQNGNFLLFYKDGVKGSAEIVKLTRTKADELPEKEVMVFASLSSGISSVDSAIDDFNRRSNKYKIVKKTYYDDSKEWTQEAYDDAIKLLYADLTGTNPPDIIDLNDLNLRELVNHGVLADLTPYLETSNVLNREEFVPSILNAYTINDKLVTIPRVFYIHTIMAKTSLVGKTPGWTLSDMMEFSDKYPDADLFVYMTKQDALETALQYNSEAFTDYEKGTCRFDSPEFIEVLEFANRFEEKSENNGNISVPKELQNNRILLYSTRVVRLREYQLNQAMFGEPTTCIGYPTSDGSQGAFLEGMEMLGITAQGSHKEGAWTFLEGYLEEYFGDMSSGLFLSSRTDVLEDQFKEAMTPEYECDENGELIEIPKARVSYGDGEMLIYAATPEQVDEIRNLIDVAMLPNDNDAEVLKIISEEAESYFKGQKTAGEVAKIIQSRVSVFVSENS